MDLIFNSIVISFSKVLVIVLKLIFLFKKINCDSNIVIFSIPVNVISIILTVGFIYKKIRYLKYKNQ